MYSAKSPGNSTLSCNEGSTRVPPECPWIARKYRKCLEELGFKKQCWNLFFGPPPFPRKLSKHQLAIAKYHQTLPWTFLPSRQILQLHHLLDELYHHVVTIWSWFWHFKTTLAEFPGSTSVHFLSPYGIDTGVNVKVGVGRGSAFAICFPVPLF